MNDDNADALNYRALIDTLETIDLQRAPLVARYGPGGTFDADRKTLLCTIREAIRLERAQRSEKTTEAALDDAAHADEAYRRYLDQAYDERTKLAELDAARTALDYRISFARAAIYANAQLARVQ